MDFFYLHTKFMSALVVLLVINCPQAPWLPDAVLACMVPRPYLLALNSIRCALQVGCCMILMCFRPFCIAYIIHINRHLFFLGVMNCERPPGLQAPLPPRLFIVSPSIVLLQHRDHVLPTIMCHQMAV